MGRRLLLLIPVLALIGVLYTQFRVEEPEVQEVVAVVERDPELEVEQEPLTVAELFRLTNLEREKAGVAPLKLDERLNKSAQRKIDTSVSENRFTHIDANGVHGYEYAWGLMPECITASENLQGDFGEPFNKIEPIGNFRYSEPHWNAILDKNADYVGYAFNEELLVVHFCDVD